MRQPPKGEKRHLRAELSLESRIYDMAVPKLIPLHWMRGLRRANAV